MHFTVAVITKDGDFDKALDPYSDWFEVDPYISETRDELIKRYRDDLEFAKKSNQKLYQESLEGRYDFSSDDNLIKSIIKEESDRWTKFDENGNLLSTYNPNGKWDWKVLGGRFSDYIILKSGKTTDSARIKDIDFDAYKCSKSKQESQKRFWEVVVEGKPRLSNEKPWMFETIYKKEYYKDTYKTLERYLKYLNSFRTYALLIDGIWTDEDTDKDYLETYDQKLSQINPDYFLTIIDCHQ